MHIPEAMTGRRLSAGRTESARYGGAPEVASGSYWMSHGIDVLLGGAFQAAFVLEATAH